MINETKDIFYLVLAFCVLWFTIFVCWLLYYFISIMREAKKMTTDVRARLQRIGDAFESLKEKFDRSINIFGAIAEGMKYVGNFVKDRRSEHKSTPKKKKAKGEKEEEEQGEVA